MAKAKDDGRWAMGGDFVARRSDGLSVGWNGESYAIRPPPLKGAALTVCPCCGKPFKTMKAAQLVADLVFPRERGGGVLW